MPLYRKRYIRELTPLFSRECEMDFKTFTCFAFFLIAISILEASEALKCRVDNDDRSQENFHDVVRTCMNPNNLQDQELHRTHYHRNNNHNNNNNNNNNSWQRRTSWGLGIPRFPSSNDDRERERERGGNRHEDDEEHEESSYGQGNNYNNRGPHNNRGRRTNHSSSLSPSSGRRRNNNRGSPLDDIDPCVIHCIFQQMRMLDNNSQPDKDAAIATMTGRLRDPELREFIKDAISECFDVIESESFETKCSISKRFAMCLEEKGKQNCEDWDDEIKRPLHKHSGLDLNKHRG